MAPHLAWELALGALGALLEEASRAEGAVRAAVFSELAVGATASSTSPQEIERQGALATWPRLAVLSIHE